jgi:hypothetical protein
VADGRSLAVQACNEWLQGAGSFNNTYRARAVATAQSAAVADSTYQTLPIDMHTSASDDFKTDSAGTIADLGQVNSDCAGVGVNTGSTGDN